MSNLQRHKDCPMRTHVGNCLIIGGFCTSIREDICDALHKSFQMGTRSRAVDKANDDAISREKVAKRLAELWETEHPEKSFDEWLKIANKWCDYFPPIVIPKPKEGEWIGEADGYWNGELIYDVWYCPFCDYRIEEDEQELLPNYCPNCGAKMKGADDE